MNARPVLWAGAADAAAAVRQLCPQAAADALARAGEICGHTFLFRDHWEMEPTREPVHFDGPVVWDAVPAGDPEWTYALNRHTIFVHLGRAWQYTGQARYLDAFVSLLGDWLDRVPRTPASENTPGVRWKPACAPKTGCVPSACSGRRRRRPWAAASTRAWPPTGTTWPGPTGPSSG